MPDEIRAVRMADLPEIYQVPQEGGQDESPDLSFLSRAMSEYERQFSRGTPIPDLMDVATYTFHSIQPTRVTQIQRGETNMLRLSNRPDPLTEREMAKLDVFYREVLTTGYAQWPLDATHRLTFYVNGRQVSIYSDERWLAAADYIYIGRTAHAEGLIADPAARLAIIAALMNATGHAGKEDLILLLEKSLSAVIAGVYENIVKPLASSSDDRPLRRLAWSSTGGLASWLDGQWVGMTGEPVEVGEGWTVVNTEQGPAEAGLPEPGSVVAAEQNVAVDENWGAEQARFRAVAERLDRGRVVVNMEELGAVVPWYANQRLAEQDRDTLRVQGFPDVATICRDNNWYVYLARPSTQFHTATVDLSRDSTAS